MRELNEEDRERTEHPMIVPLWEDLLDGIRFCPVDRVLATPIKVMLFDML